MSDAGGNRRTGASNGALSLQDAARRVGVAAATLRRWVREGLIPPYAGSWSPAAVSHARIVARLRERGHSLGATGLETADHMLELTRRLLPLSSLYGVDRGVHRAGAKRTPPAPMNEVDLVARVREEGLLAAGRRVVVLLSGGRDSTCLLDIAVRVAGADAVSALHVNYGLRTAAREDERHCAELCRRLGVRLEVHRPAPRARGNLQAWAREVRYRAARELAREGSADVATGHTATDQVETILYRLASSPSRRALLGMRSREGSLVRPLLRFTREETAAYCRGRGLSWREDESNATGAYARNRVRSELLPALRTVHPAAERNVFALAQVLRDEAEVLDALVGKVLGPGEARVSQRRLRELPSAIRRLVVQRLADAAADGFAPGAARRADELAGLGDGRGTAMLDIGCGLRAVAEYGELRIERLGGPGAAPPEAVVLAIPGSVAFGSLEVSCEIGAPAREPGVVDRAALGCSELVVRSWGPGDRMAPIGLGGATKSLQDLFTARRVPRLERSRVPVVVAEGEVVWVAGVATSERHKVTSATKDAVRLVARTVNQGAQPARP